MVKKDKIAEKLKEGVSVEEIEKFARRYTPEVFIIISMIIATISSVFGFFTGPSWSLIFSGLCLVVTIVLPDPIEKMFNKFQSFLVNQNKTTLIIIGIVRIILAIFIPFILFTEMGFLAGIAFHSSSKIVKEHKKKNEEEESNEEEHI
jgi:uncharacterized membrane protein